MWTEIVVIGRNSTEFLSTMSEVAKIALYNKCQPVWLGFIVRGGGDDEVRPVYSHFGRLVLDSFLRHIVVT